MAKWTKDGTQQKTDVLDINIPISWTNRTKKSTKIKTFVLNRAELLIHFAKRYPVALGANAMNGKLNFKELCALSLKIAQVTAVSPIFLSDWNMH